MTESRVRQISPGAAGAILLFATILSAPEAAAEIDDEIACLAMNIYWEADAENVRDQRAVAHVTLNRVASSDFPDTICAVVRQGRKGKYKCQFHWFCDGRPDTPTDSDSWDRSVAVAENARRGASSDPTGGAVYFHLRRVKPSWAGKKTRTVAIGDHLFYK